MASYWLLLIVWLQLRCQQSDASAALVAQVSAGRCPGSALRTPRDHSDNGQDEAWSLSSRATAAGAVRWSATRVPGSDIKSGSWRRCCDTMGVELWGGDLTRSIIIVLAFAAFAMSLSACGSATTNTAPAGPASTPPSQPPSGTSDVGHPWSQQREGSGKIFTSVSFTDINHGWIVGFDGTVFATTDGGATWTEQSSGTSEDLTRVAFRDSTHGWAVGGNGTIIATSDGGVTWVRQDSGSTASIFDVAFPDATHGWAVGSSLSMSTVEFTGIILATTDGGASWNKQWTAKSVGSHADLSAIAFADGTHGWAVGDKGVILATTDGGVFWSLQHSEKVSGHTVDFLVILR